MSRGVWHFLITSKVHLTLSRTIITGPGNNRTPEAVKMQLELGKYLQTSTALATSGTSIAVVIW